MNTNRAKSDVTSSLWPAQTNRFALNEQACNADRIGSQMTVNTQPSSPDSPAQNSFGIKAEDSPWSSLLSVGLFAALAIALLGSLQLFYGLYYSVQTDVAGIALSGRLADTLGNSFSEYSLYFPPAERVWTTIAVRLSDLTGLRLDLAVVLMTGVAVLFSAGLAYHIRRMTVGATPLFLLGSVAVLVLLPILYKNVFAVREHLVVLGLWPYFILRISDPDDTKIGRKTRLVVGLWLGATLLLKYLYSLVVFLVEIADAAAQRRPLSLFRIENVVAGSIVAIYLFLWLVIDPSQREAIAVVVSAIDANLTSRMTNLEQAGIHAALAALFLLLAYVFKLSLRKTLIGLAMVVGAIIAAWIQSRWYTHHLFPITMAYAAWLWMIHRDIKLLWILALLLFFVRPIVGEFRGTVPYQESVREVELAMDEAGLSVDGKRVGLLTMHPTPFNQYLASNGASRWIASVNNSYVAAELKPLDRPENKGLVAPPVKLDDPGRQMLHDEMLRLWEDMPPDALILDQSSSWPLQFIDVQWTEVFSEDARMQAILSQYRPVFEHKGKWVQFRYYERIDSAAAAN